MTKKAMVKATAVQMIKMPEFKNKTTLLQANSHARLTAIYTQFL